MGQNLTGTNENSPEQRYFGVMGWTPWILRLKLGQAFPIFLDFQCGLWSQSSQIFFCHPSIWVFFPDFGIGWWPIWPILGILASFKLPALRHGLLLWQFGFWCHHLRASFCVPYLGSNRSKMSFWVSGWRVFDILGKGSIYMHIYIMYIYI